MTLHTLILIILWTLGVILFGGVLLVTFLIGKETTKENPNKALVLVKTGSHINRTFKAKIKTQANKGRCFAYDNKFVLLPSTYEEIYFKNKRLIFINRAGQLIASPFANDVLQTDTEKEDLIYAVIESHIGSDSIKALHGKQTVNIIVVAVIAFAIGILAIYGFNYAKEYMAQQQTAPTQQQTAPTQQPIEVR